MCTSTPHIMYVFLFGINILMVYDLPCSEIALNIFHRHLTINDLNDVHCGTHAVANRYTSQFVVGSATVLNDFRCAGDK